MTYTRGFTVFLYSIVIRWLQPESYLDAKQCELIYNKDDLKCSWPAVLTVHSKDQYGNLVHVPNLKVGRDISGLV